MGACSVPRLRGRCVPLPRSGYVSASRGRAGIRLHRLGSEGLKFRTFRAVETLVQNTALRRPLVLVCEDLQWADPTSLELLESLLSVAERAPVLIVCAFRPETEHGCWGIKEAAARLYRHRHTDLRLEPLSDSESAALVDNLLFAEGISQQLKGRILGLAEGNPLFAEEIVRSLMDSGVIVYDDTSGRWRSTQRVADISIPDTLHGVLMARIDRLPRPAKQVLQLASVIGRIFAYRVLSAIGEWPDLDAHLVTLQREQMVRERVRFPELEYIFKHHLTQDTAYRTLLKRQRRALHRRVAEALERVYPDRIEGQVELLAHHWDRAEEPQKASAYMARAGQKAARQHANEEALGYFGHALASTGPGEEFDGVLALCALTCSSTCTAVNRRPVTTNGCSSPRGLWATGRRSLRPCSAWRGRTTGWRSMRRIRTRRTGHGISTRLPSPSPMELPMCRQC